MLIRTSVSGDIISCQMVVMNIPKECSGSLHQVGDYVYQSTRQNIPADLYLQTLSSLGKHQVRK
jgi:hypothetical protein